MLPWRILRYPAVFGACLATYFGAFSLRKMYFKNEMEDVREKNLTRAVNEHLRLEAVKDEVRAGLAQAKEKK